MSGEITTIKLRNAKDTRMAKSKFYDENKNFFVYFV